MITEHLRRRGYNPSVSKSTVAGIVKCYLVTFGAKDVAKLAQSDAEVLKAVIKLAERERRKTRRSTETLGRRGKPAPPQRGSSS